MGETGNTKTGRIGWFDLTVPDAGAVRDFYQQVAVKRKEYFDLTQSIFEKIGGGASTDSRLAALYLFGTLNWIYQWYKPGRDPEARELASRLSDIYLKGFPRMGKADEH